MRILFIRHAPAMDRLEWYDDDVFRPLTQKGFALAQKTFAKLTRLIKIPTLIISSEAVRARQTAEILAKAFGSPLEFSASLNPQSSFKSIEWLLKDDVAFVGHEPDFSQIIKEMTGANIKLKKGGVAEIEYDKDSKIGFLKLLLSPKILI